MNQRFDFNKITERIKSNPDNPLECVVRLLNTEDIPIETESIHLHFRRTNLYVIDLSIEIDLIKVGTIKFTSKADLACFWLFSEDIPQKTMFDNRIVHTLDIKKISKKLPLSVLVMLVTTYFPTNWLILLREE